ncbi:hypothetical protein WJX74_003644 [Apatococcus lobatus]|uniref:Uncharacterized protein n=1 Tax=Apatococcus lobatus TaxID=904363 RepID=A0AAW1QDP1_9CHLO
MSLTSDFHRPASFARLPPDFAGSSDARDAFADLVIPATADSWEIEACFVLLADTYAKSCLGQDHQPAHWPHPTVRMQSAQESQSQNAWVQQRCAGPLSACNRAARFVYIKPLRLTLAGSSPAQMSIRLPHRAH